MFAPDNGYNVTDKNAYSAVLYVKYGQFSVLLTGDVEQEGEQLLTAEMKRQGIADVTVLKAAHHGSSSSSSEVFLAQANPLVTVISCGEDNRYGHPHKEALERLEDCGTKIYQTPESGAVIIRTDGKKMQIEEFRKGK